MAPPVVIVGAPRSGTNMLRDLLTAFPGHGTWPCDEINPIWRHGNTTHPSDAFGPDMATPEVAAFIRGRFDSLARRRGLDTVVEKTCATSLRVPFVDRVLPEARYVFIVRDGYDAAPSARKRWHARAEPRYLLAKARWVPLSDLPRYAWRFLRNRWHKLTSGQQRLAWWGPTLDGMQDVLASHTIDEVCALQWKACVESSLDAFESIDPARVHRLRYEDVVADPAGTVAGLAAFLGVEAPDLSGHPAFDGISPRSVGKGRADLGPDGLALLAPIVAPTMERLGYPETA
ncbi:MAG: sulfotransferase [Actinobacteria bacterium]|nr:sulfotransferase [Actinomycetota bacterium]